MAIKTLEEAIAAIEAQEVRISDLEKYNSIMTNIGSATGADDLRAHIAATKAKWKESADKGK